MRIRHAFAAPFILTAALAHGDTLPKAKKGQPVFEEDGSCYTLGRKQVRCPPNLILPDPEFAADGTRFDDYTLSCEREEELTCPDGATCNPPPPQPVTCPDKLLPHLAKKVKPTKKKGKACYYGKVKVVCP